MHKKNDVTVRGENFTYKECGRDMGEGGIFINNNTNLCTWILHENC
jgi:hypothetical protein